MSSQPVRDVLRRQLSRVIDKLEGLEGDRIVTVHLDDVVALTFPMDVGDVRRAVDYQLSEIYRQENEEYEQEAAANRKAVRS